MPGKKGIYPPQLPKPTPESIAKMQAAGLKVKREKASMQKTARLILEMSVGMLDEQLMSAITYLKPGMTVQDAIIHTQAIKAIQFADTKAAEFVRDTSGQKPTDKTEIEGHISYEEALKKYTINEDSH